MRISVVLISIIVAVSGSTKAQVMVQKVGTNPTLMVPSAVLEVESTTKGFLPPRMTQAQRNAIANPDTGLIVYCTDCGYNPGELHTFNGTAWVSLVNTVASTVITHCNPSNITAIVDVINPTTGKTWMDRNLGSNRLATSATDTQAYGSLFQWGRGTDGHQCVNRYTGDGVATSSTTTTQSSANSPGHADFILNGSDWRNPKNDSLWQGVNGVNNPCPIGYRLPTETEINAERLTWSTNNAAGAFASSLRWVMSGYRSSTGTLTSLGTDGLYWTSTIVVSNSRFLQISSSSASMGGFFRSNGLSVRCIKE